MTTMLTIDEMEALIAKVGTEFHEDPVLRSAVQKLIAIHRRAEIIAEDMKANMEEARYA